MISSAAAKRVYQQVAVVQVVLTFSDAGLALAMAGTAEAKAMLAGGVIALTNTLLLVWRMRDDRRVAEKSAQQHLLMFYRSGLERFFVVGVLLAMGMGPLGFKPLPLMASFVLGQVALIVCSIIRRVE